MNSTYYGQMKSPIGILTIYANDNGITRISLSSQQSGSESGNAITQLAIKELELYFRGELTQFTVPLDPNGTPFQMKVWAVLKNIPYGQLVSYKDIAQQVDKPKGFRAVGHANSKNPIPIICACHRVISADGSLGGYSLGLDIKTTLIQLEKTTMEKKEVANVL